MATYLYCVRNDAWEPPTALVGVDGARVRAIDAALTAWVSDVSDVPVTPTVERLQAHDAVCAAALEVGDTPLPIRFGQAFSDDAAIVSAIDTRAPALRTRLMRVSGCVELRVVVTHGRETETAANRGEPADPASGTDAVETGPEGPGTAFLRRLARAGRADIAREVGCEEARHAIRAATKSLIVEQHRCETARGLAYFPVLVRRPDVVDFRAAVSDILAAQAIDLSVLGPFAPYSFAGDA